MKRFPRAAAVFQELVDERGRQLRALDYDGLARAGQEPVEHVTVESRPATIGIIVDRQPDGSLRVVVQGFLKARWMPGSHVALDGFYKRPDGAIAPLEANDFYAIG
jgi:hypothetical protein